MEEFCCFALLFYIGAVPYLLICAVIEMKIKTWQKVIYCSISLIVHAIGSLTICLGIGENLGEVLRILEYCALGLIFRQIYFYDTICILVNFVTVRLLCVVLDESTQLKNIIRFIAWTGILPIKERKIGIIKFRF